MNFPLSFSLDLQYKWTCHCRPPNQNPGGVGWVRLLVGDQNKRGWKPWRWGRCTVWRKMRLVSDWGDQLRNSLFSLKRQVEGVMQFKGRDYREWEFEPATSEVTGTGFPLHDSDSCCLWERKRRSHFSQVALCYRVQGKLGPVELIGSARDTDHWFSLWLWWTILCSVL